MPTVKYAKLVNLGNYENERIELEDEVRAGETRAEVYERLRTEVHELLGRSDPLRNLEARIGVASDRATTAERRAREVLHYWREAADRHEELRQLLEKHGAQIDPLPGYLLPPDAPQPAPVVIDLDNGDSDDSDNESGM